MLTTILNFFDLHIFEFFAAAVISAAITGIWKNRIEARQRENLEKRLRQAEDAAFGSTPDLLKPAYPRAVKPVAGDEEPDIRYEGGVPPVNVMAYESEESKARQAGKLFDLYNKQIEKYQTETQSRAKNSFLFAILSMIAGLSFVVFGGLQVLNNPDLAHAVAATGISGIGGAVGAYITKTFLDVHRLSLSQLNHYFRQPVLNAHILTAQRIADQIADGGARQKAYESILKNVVALIADNGNSLDVWSQIETSAKPTKWRASANSRTPKSQTKEDRES